VFFFTAAALFIWLYYIAIQTGFPAKPAANVAKLAPGFRTHFSPLELLVAIAGTLAWLWLVRWRTGRHRQALWKSLVLPASGVVLGWLLVMTLWLPPIDYARSYRPWVHRIARHLQPGECVAAPQMPRGGLAALEYFGGIGVEGRGASANTTCPVLLLPLGAPTPAGWQVVARVQRPTDRDEVAVLHRRGGAR
jgi:4-amino-4-deoxy-L-arabinose transferase-like glycosyltransferase